MAPVEYFRTVLEEVDIPVSVFQYPLASGCGYPTETLMRIAALPGVVAIKEGSDTITAYEDNYRRLKAEAPRVAMLPSNFDWFLAQCAVGADGILSGLASLAPHLLSRPLAGDGSRGPEGDAGGPRTGSIPSSAPSTGRRRGWTCIPVSSPASGTWGSSTAPCRVRRCSRSRGRWRVTSRGPLTRPASLTLPRDLLSPACAPCSRVAEADVRTRSVHGSSRRRARFAPTAGILPARP